MEFSVERATPPRWKRSSRRRIVYREFSKKIDELLDRLYVIEDRFEGLGYHLPPVDHQEAKIFFKKNQKLAHK
jgi:hypothetical protein